MKIRKFDIDDDGKEIKNYCTITIYPFSSSSKFVIWLEPTKIDIMLHL